MCTTCGCGLATGATRAAPDHHHPHPHNHPHHGHAHHGHPGHGPESHGLGDPGDHGHSHPAGEAETRRIAVERALLAKNDTLAEENRRRLTTHGLVTLNLVSSPGAGKTSLLVRTLTDLQERLSTAVVEGDQATDLDARRIAETGAPAVQINTGPGCHLDAAMVAGALDRLDLHALDLLVIENVGNLVCPAAFDLGETAKVVVVSVTEGDDKPLKYPDMFAAARLMVVTKTDLLAHVPADLDRLMDNARRVNPAIETLAVSALSGEGLAAWYRWIEERRAQASAGPPVAAGQAALA
jgi:hydrogenase nickel incorporation protein HypB